MRRQPSGCRSCAAHVQSQQSGLWRQVTVRSEVTFRQGRSDCTGSRLTWFLGWFCEPHTSRRTRFASRRSDGERTGEGVKLEAAIAAVGESDPTCATLREALARAKSQAQERPVADRIKHTNIFIERARKRVSSLQEDVKKAQAVVALAQEKLARKN